LGDEGGVSGLELKEECVHKGTGMGGETRGGCQKTQVVLGGGQKRPKGRRHKNLPTGESLVGGGGKNHQQKKKTVWGGGGWGGEFLDYLGHQTKGNIRENGTLKKMDKREAGGGGGWRGTQKSVGTIGVGKGVVKKREVGAGGAYAKGKKKKT